MAYYANTPRARSASMTPKLSDLMPAISDHSIGNHMGNNSPRLGHSKHYFNSARPHTRCSSSSGYYVTGPPIPEVMPSWRGTLYSRYSTNDWDSSNKQNFHLSERERNLAERLRADAYRAVKATDARTRNRQQANTKRLGERVQDIHFWKDELNNEIREMENEIDNLTEHKRILEKAYGDTRNPLAIAEECLLQREKRQAIDQVHDDVERNLSREVDIIKRCQEKMRRLIEKSAIQLKMDRAAQHACEKDSKDKHHAHGLDDRMHQLRNSSAGLGFHPGIENVDNTITVPYSWVKFTQENIARSQKEREISEKLRGEIDALLRQCANEMWSQFNSVNNSFNGRIQETHDAKNKLQAHLQRVNNEIRDVERAVDLLRRAIHDKEYPMKLAQTRLDERTRRINVELCNDPVMKGLQKEINEIRESVRMLKEKLRQAENALVRLLKTKSTLEEDIGVKENSLQIDSRGCMGLRKNMPMDPKVGPIFNMPLAY